MGMMINRRRVMGGKSVPSYLKGYTLIHHWEADDWTVGTDWVDRVGGLVFTRNGNPVKENGLIAVCLSEGCFTLTPNAAAPSGINMGSLWVVEVEGMIKEHSSLANRTQSVADFGSIGLSYHSFSPFSVGSANKLTFNPKFTGNDNATLYINHFDFTPYYGKLVKATIGTKEIDSDTVLPFYVLEEEIHNSPNTLTKSQALFNRNFNQNVFYIGRTAIGRSDFDNINDFKYIKSIKIYTKY